MIAFIYRMRLKPGREEDYDRAWRQVTLIARDRFGSLGSHLFAPDAGMRVAIALWPDHESRDRFFSWRRATGTTDAAALTDAVEEYLGEEELASLDNLWVGIPPR